MWSLKLQCNRNPLRRLPVSVPVMLDHMELARRHIGLKEMPGHDVNTPLIMAMLLLDAEWPSDDEVPWCAAYVGWICWLAGLPRTKSLMARSWLTLGTHVHINAAQEGDIVILNRGGPQDASVLNAPGHVGFYISHDDTFIHLLGGNQSNRVHEGAYPKINLLGIRRLT